MEQLLHDVEVLFVAGFGPITQNNPQSQHFYQHALGLPLKAMAGNSDYLLTEREALPGVKHFALWPLEQAAQSCFGQGKWPQNLPVPQAWLEFDVADLEKATQALLKQGYHLLVANRQEPWGQSVTRLLSPEGLLVGITLTPWLRDQ
ncbi:glyoxalase [Serratia sp. S1B]|nr:glyoxalase [Serratia sp. S1B]